MTVVPEQFRALGKDVRELDGLDTFPCPVGVRDVILTSDEVSAVCPITC